MNRRLFLGAVGARLDVFNWVPQDVSWREHQGGFTRSTCQDVGRSPPICLASTTSSYSRVTNAESPIGDLTEAVLCVEGASTSVAGIHAQEEPLVSLLLGEVHGLLHQR